MVGKIGHSPGPWQWGEDCGELDSISENGNPLLDRNPPSHTNLKPEKYMSCGLDAINGEPVLPLRVDHYDLEYDGYWLDKGDRILMGHAPEMYDLLHEVIRLADTEDENEAVVFFDKVKNLLTKMKEEEQ